MEWIAPTLAAAFIALLAYLAKSKLDGIAKESSEGLSEVRKIQSTMLRQADLENAVLKMANELRSSISTEYYTRREAERLEELVRRTPIG